MNLISLIEQFDPGHFHGRYESLQRLSTKMSELGFFPLTISGKDIECYWVRIQSVEEGKHHSVTYELYDDILEEKTGLLESLKKVAKYENDGLGLQDAVL
jgi:hypothetical protein